MVDPMSVQITIEHLEEIGMPPMAGTVKQLQRDLITATEYIADREMLLASDKGELVAKVEQQHERIAELEADNKKLAFEVHDLTGTLADKYARICKRESELNVADERIAALESALRPFVEAYERDKGSPATMGGNNWGSNWESYEDAAALLGDGREEELRDEQTSTD